jgi:DNA-binding IclR family transcriptional regulator
MAKPESPPPLTPRAKQVVNFVVNSVALGTHDDDAEVGAIAKELGTSPGRLETILRKLTEQGYVTVKGDFVYPTAAALKAQQPSITEREVRAILRDLR